MKFQIISFFESETEIYQVNRILIEKFDEIVKQYNSNFFNFSCHENLIERLDSSQCAFYDFFSVQTARFHRLA